MVQPGQALEEIYLCLHCLQLDSLQRFLVVCSVNHRKVTVSKALDSGCSLGIVYQSEFAKRLPRGKLADLDEPVGLVGQVIGHSLVLGDLVRRQLHQMDHFFQPKFIRQLRFFERL